MDHNSKEAYIDWTSKRSSSIRVLAKEYQRNKIEKETVNIRPLVMSHSGTGFPPQVSRICLMIGARLWLISELRLYHQVRSYFLGVKLLIN